MKLAASSLALALLASVPSPEASGDDVTFSFGGHAKYQLVPTTLPTESLLRDYADSPLLDHGMELRLNLEARWASLGFEMGYQLLGMAGDTIELTRDLPPEAQVFYPRYPEDDARLANLTHVLHDKGRTALLERLDRLTVSYTGEKVVARLGRQALSWGNGLIYTPMDILNPFDPAAVDKEYKIGDDMAYLQLLRGNGDDLQAVAVFRRDLETHNVASDWSSFAAKYHALLGESELDLLAAQHFGDPLAGIGGNHSLGGAVWRGDLVTTFADDKTFITGVTSLSYSWVWGGKNLSGALEYFYNGFGQPDGDYTPESLAQNPELLARIVRGELFTLGRHYVAATTTIELHPLFLATPNAFVNVSDGSALLQLATKGDLRENLVLLAALSFPVGATGTEFGGIESGAPDRSLSVGPGAFIQLGLYF